MIYKLVKSHQRYKEKMAKYGGSLLRATTGQTLPHDPFLHPFSTLPSCQM